jgi:acetyl esterase/lipase
MLADPLIIMESEIKPDRLFPVTYAMAGTHDILLDHTRRLEKALVLKNIPNVVSYFPNQGHAFHLIGISDQAKIFWKENLTFLARKSSAVV